MAKQCKQLDWSTLPAFFGPRELARLLGIGEAAAYTMARQPGFPVLKVGRQYRISREGLQRWLEQQLG
ncbi:helix-turn-helix domain-containing protein [Desulfurispora thermophila]|uniref:helix-turn-helix domain-containing protein n=1 Tax=Desulfurispora thermophila TaxID=265470 RepID=UPI00036FADD4|nr:helix-turn-helix domain-containing protein [Desulfurispora thermophila]